MAFSCGFYNSINHDRKYNAEQMTAIFDGIIKDGVFDSIGGLFAVTPGSGMQVVVDSGKAWFNHTWSINDSKLPLFIEPSDITLKRYDAVVLEINSSQSVRANSIKIVKGVAGTNPSKPQMLHTEEVHQYPIAYIYIAAGVLEVAKSAIQNVVGTSECPFVTGILDSMPVDALFSQWEGDFEEWFENVQSQLEGDIAANLQRQIDLSNSNINKIAASYGFTKAAEFKTAGTHRWVPSESQKLAFMVLVGGGGGGGSSVTGYITGGGGAGGGGVVITPIMTLKPNEEILLVVGYGGEGGKSGLTSHDPYGGDPGGSTSCLGFIATGGRGGGCANSNGYGTPGTGGIPNGASGGKGGGRSGGTGDPMPGVGTVGSVVNPIYPFGSLSAGGGGGGGASGAEMIGAEGGISSLGKGGKGGDRDRGADGETGCGGGGAGATSVGKPGGKGGDGIVLIYTMGVNLK